MADSGATLIVADSGPLIGLTKLGLLELLPRSFDAVYIPRTVLSEATGSRTHPDADTLLRFIAANDGGRIRITPDTTTQLTLELGKWLDPGETQAINLAHGLGCPVLSGRKAGKNARRPIRHSGFRTAGVARAGQANPTDCRAHPLSAPAQTGGLPLVRSVDFRSVTAGGRSTRLTTTGRPPNKWPAFLIFRSHEVRTLPHNASHPFGGLPWNPSPSPSPSMNPSRS
jgi:predicted nucleic acid-binding protein